MRRADDRHKQVLAHLGVYCLLGPPIGLVAFFLAALPSNQHLSLGMVGALAPLGAILPSVYTFAIVPASATGLGVGLTPSDTLAVRAFAGLIAGYAISFVFFFLAPYLLLGMDDRVLMRFASLFGFAGALSAVACAVITPGLVAVLRMVRRLALNT